MRKCRKMPTRTESYKALRTPGILVILLQTVVSENKRKFKGKKKGLAAKVKA